MLIIYLLTIMMTFMFIYMNHPLMMVIILVMISTMISLISGMSQNSYWFSYMLFLIMVGGMLVVFIYMTSVTSNEKFTLKTKPLIMSFLVIFPLILMNKLPKNFMNNTTNFSNKTQEFMMNKFINLPMMMLMIMMIIYLLITLIATVKITKMKLGPLRQKY